MMLVVPQPLLLYLRKQISNPILRINLERLYSAHSRFRLNRIPILGAVDTRAISTFETEQAEDNINSRRAKRRRWRRSGACCRLNEKHKSGRRRWLGGHCTGKCEPAAAPFFSRQFAAAAISLESVAVI